MNTLPEESRQSSQPTFSSRDELIQQVVHPFLDEVGSHPQFWDLDKFAQDYAIERNGRYGLEFDTDLDTMKLAMEPYYTGPEFHTTLYSTYEELVEGEFNSLMRALDLPLENLNVETLSAEVVERVPGEGFRLNVNEATLVEAVMPRHLAPVMEPETGFEPEPPVSAESLNHQLNQSVKARIETPQEAAAPPMPAHNRGATR